MLQVSTKPCGKALKHIEEAEEIEGASHDRLLYVPAKPASRITSLPTFRPEQAVANGQQLSTHPREEHEKPLVPSRSLPLKPWTIIYLLKFDFERHWPRAVRRAVVHILLRSTRREFHLTYLRGTFCW